MGFQEVSRVEMNELIRRWQAGGSIRGLSRVSGLSRPTIRKYLRAATELGVRQDGPPATEEQITALMRLHGAGPHQPLVPTAEVLAPWAETIQRWIQQERLRLTRVQELLAQRECRVSYMSLHRFVERRGWLRTRHTTVRMAETGPGEVAEMDFGRLGLVWDPESLRRRVVWALVIVLVYSRFSFVWPLFRHLLADIIEGLEAAWAFFQGIPRYLVLDNFPAAVAGPDPFHPRLTRGFLEYAQQRGFFVDPTRVRHPKDKPHVERHLDYVVERFFKGGEFNGGLLDMRHQARRWCLEVAGQRVHGTTRRLPLVMFREEEQSHLLPYGGEPYEVPDWRTATVHRDHHIAYDYAIYSVPDSRCPLGTKVEVRGDSKLVRIYHRGIPVKVHPRQPRGGRSTDPDDYPAVLTPYTMRGPNHVKRQAAQMGPEVGAFAERLLSGPLPWAKLRQGLKLLRLGERYTPARLEAACSKALEVELIDVRRVQRILEQALEQEALAREGTSLPPPPGRFARPGASFAVASRRLPPVPQQTDYARRLL